MGFLMKIKILDQFTCAIHTTDDVSYSYLFKGQILNVDSVEKVSESYCSFPSVHKITLSEGVYMNLTELDFEPQDMV